MTGAAADEVGRAIREVMEPGENVLAATKAKAMASWWPILLFLILPVLGFFWAITVLGSTTSLNIVIAMALVWVPIGIAYQWLIGYSSRAERRPVYLAVTEQQLICLKLKKSGQAGSLMFNAPLLTVQIRCVRRPLQGWSYVRYRGLSMNLRWSDVRYPGVSSHGLWLYSPRSQRNDMTKVLQELQSAGARVDGPSALA
jgi:hypothetical protein